MGQDQFPKTMVETQCLLNDYILKPFLMINLRLLITVILSSLIAKHAGVLRLVWKFLLVRCFRYFNFAA